MRAFNYDLFSDVCGCVLLALIFAVPAWLIFFPPKRVRSWPDFVRPLLAIVCTQIIVTGIFSGIVFPVTRAYGQSFHGSVILLDYPINFLHPSLFWLPVICVSCVLFCIRAFHLDCARVRIEMSSRAKKEAERQTKAEPPASA